MVKECRFSTPGRLRIMSIHTPPQFEALLDLTVRVKCINIHHKIYQLISIFIFQFHQKYEKVLKTTQNVPKTVDNHQEQLVLGLGHQF